MGVVRPFLAVGFMAAALLGVSAGAAYAASVKGEVPFTQTGDEFPLVNGNDYTVSYNASGGEGRKVSGGFTLSGLDDGLFFGGKTYLFCSPTKIIFEVNPPKNKGVDYADYVVIDGGTVDVVGPGGSVPNC